MVSGGNELGGQGGWRFAWVICGKVAIFQVTSGAMSSAYANKLGWRGRAPGNAQLGLKVTERVRCTHSVRNVGDIPVQ